ncbi:hypothetical protein E4T80_04805 [Muribacter muris]|uniref:Uncharacterized protein n=1 Tax=Muribacter muris TaxID=67855 RepID=A0A4Y9K2L6_9PAST|nr:hypothetical protein [Muribacter muris]MBF0784801.1 hypothetical protein [Muribacter muris]MBF0826640.1 hypothetical protein [Muribacter muris]TFV11037.1 hypothetical protein E4T80_04805 [Muribacter muris]
MLDTGKFRDLLENEIINFITNNEISIGFIIAIIIFIIIQFFQKFEYIHRHYANREYTKINNLLNIKENLSNIYLKELTQEVIDEYVFRVCTTISANKKLREIILVKHKENDIELFHFKRASRFFKLTDEGLKIEISKLDIFGKYFNYAFSIVLFLLVLYILILISLSENITLQKYLISLFLSCSFSIGALYILTQNFPLKSAIYLKEKLNL